MRNTNYAFSGAMYEVQKTLEAFFGRCEVTITEDKPRHAVEVEVKYKTHSHRGTKLASHDLSLRREAPLQT